MDDAASEFVTREDKAVYETDQPVLYSVDNGIATVTMNRPTFNNVQNSQMTYALDAALRKATDDDDVKVIVLRGGSDFWSNGIHLNTIEAAESPADESWANINAIDDLAEAILRCESQLTVAAVGGNTGAGGCFLARAADFVWVRDGVMLNPHYKNMGNLYGSEYWTYLLPGRVGDAAARAIMAERLPLGATRAARTGLIDAAFGADRPAFEEDYARRLREAYPVRPDGRTLFPFRRLFIVATRP